MAGRFSVRMHALPDTESMRVLGELGQFRRSAHLSDVTEVKCRFLNYPNGWRGEASHYDDYWLSMGDLALLRPGNKFVGQLFTGDTVRQHSPMDFKSFERALVGEIIDEDGEQLVLQGISEPTPEALVAPRRGAVFSFNRDEGRRLYIRSSELIRFYLTPLSLLASRFLEPKVFKTGGPGLFDPENTGPDPDDPSVYHLTPGPLLADEGSAIHLALLLASEDLRDFWEAAAVSAGQGSISRPVYPACGAPSGLRSFKGYGYVTRSILLAGRRLPEAAMMMGLLEDRRASPFKRVIVHVDRRAPEFEPLGDGQSVIDRVAQIRDYIFGHRVRPGRRRASFGGAPDALLRSQFPGLRGVRAEYPVKPRASDERVRFHFIPPTTNTVSTSDPEHGGEAGHMVLGPRFKSAPPARPESRPRGERLLFSQVPDELAEIVEIDLVEAGFPLSPFVEATRRFRSLQLGDFVDPQPLDPARAVLWRLPASWGAWAAPRGATSARIGAVINLQIGSVHACAFELDRFRARDATAVGIAARADGAPMNRAQMNTVLHHAVVQKSSSTAAGEEDAAWRGTWPTDEQFSDVRSLVLLHTALRREFPPFLARALQDAAASL